jgi:hypothetical protein
MSKLTKRVVSIVALIIVILFIVGMMIEPLLWH